MKRNRILIFVLLAVAAAMFISFVTGCGDDNEGNGAPGPQDIPGQASGGDEKEEIDACGILTQEDAEDLMEETASRDESGAIIVDPGMLGECLWSHDTNLSSHLIQFRIWDGEMYFAPTDDSESLDLGDRGAIRVNDFAGVDIEWIQDGKTINLSYFTTGPDVPDATAKVEEVKALAEEISDRL